MDLCSGQERCRTEIAEKLSARELPSQDIDSILETLEKENFINESRYAASFARDKLRLNKWGKVKIRYMLQQRRIPEALIAGALEGIDEQEYRDMLKEELQKKRSTIRGSNAYDLKAKLLRFARQRGFESGLIYRILDELI